MLASQFVPLSHIASRAAWSTTQLVLAVTVLAFGLLLIAEHIYVKHEGISLFHARKPLAAIVAVALAAVVAPTPGFAQSTITPMGLPDLISDPPFIWIERNLNTVDGEVIRTLAFDGFLHNIGEGALDLAGNPQVEGGVKQRVFNGETWEDVGTPLVRFETDDGHNHFHLINAAEYTLWNEAQSEQVEIGSKIGFCLLDTQQRERGVDATYNIDEINYCNADEPDSTDLRMGISPGWVDIYEASVTLQWVDISNTLPGRYWVGAVIDPNDEIVESNEDNNGLVFSSNKYAVSGYVARELPVQSAQIELKAITYGTVGGLAYVIVDPPTHGSLSVPTGADIFDPNISYVAERGYAGPDSFTYYAHDIDSPFPYDPKIVEVMIEADGSDSTDVANFDGDVVVTADTSEVSASRYERILLPLSIEGGEAGVVVRWFAEDLPPGLRIDEETGVIEGELTVPADVTSTVIAQVDGTEFETSIIWNVADARQASLRSVNDISTPLERRDLVIGGGTAENTYEATGLPDGVVLTEGQPSILGTPSESGEFDVVVNELLDGEVVDSVTFTLTVRPAARPAFPL